MCALRMGIDTGSTTAKLAILDEPREILFSTYRRHHAETVGTLQQMLQDAKNGLGDIEVDLLVTGSAGMGVSESFDLPFIQEVVASAEVVHQLYPTVRALIDIGGEDAKMIFFDEEGPPAFFARRAGVGTALLQGLTRRRPRTRTQ
jgi:activator of 2-hydroxyglutaryl-CoA dehydratase